MLIRVRYNAERFPRTVNLPKHKTMVFHPDKREIEFEEYDAYLLLKNNTRIALGNWEFSVVGVEKTENLGAEAQKEAEIKAETPVSAPKIEKKGKDMPKQGRPAKK